MWDLPGPGLEPVSPALAGGFLTTAPPGKPYHLLNKKPGDRWPRIALVVQQGLQGPQGLSIPPPLRVQWCFCSHVRGLLFPGWLTQIPSIMYSTFMPATKAGSGDGGWATE